MNKVITSRQLLEQAYEGLDPKTIVDYHVHVVGTDTEETQNFVHPGFLSWRHPFLYLFSRFFQNAFAIRDVEHADEQMLVRLKSLAQRATGKFCLLAFDGYYDDNGVLNKKKTYFYVSNEYTYQVASKQRDLFIPAMSVHPYRDDALDELEKWAENGIRLVKWLPNVMGMNPADKRCLPFYRKMQELGLILLTHTGHESAIPIVTHQEFGNPLLLRSALDEGVKVIMAHSATCGKNRDLDHPTKKRVRNFDLFLRMAEEVRYEKLLFGDISAVTLLDRMHYLDRLIEASRGVLAGRLVNGSDYPMPCANLLISTRALQFFGHITAEERQGMNEIYRSNPLVFDFVLKRTLRHSKTGQTFPKNVFVVHKSLDIR